MAKINLRNLKYFKRGVIEYIQNPVQLSQGTQICYAGTSVGFGLATITSIIAKSWGFAIALFFFTILQIIFFLAENKKYKGMVALEKQIKHQMKLNEVLDKLN